MPFNTIWPVQPIGNAKDIGLQENPGTLPNLAETVGNWFQLCRFDKIIKTIVNFQVIETTTPINFQGVVMTEPKRKLVQDAHGQRRWKSKIVYAWPTLQLSPDDVILYENVQYRIGATIDFKQSGYIAYEMLQDYDGSGPVTE